MAQHIVITGASRGIGLEMARQAVARGDRVSALLRNPTAGAHAEGPALSVHRADVTDPASLAAAASAVTGPVDLLVCNAGLYRGRGAPFADGATGEGGDGDFGPDAWAETLAANVSGVFHSVAAFLPALRAAPGGARIAILSSVMASSARAPGGSYIYRASKAAVTNLARNLAIDLAAEGIAVGAYHPGWVCTDMGGSAADIDAATAASGLLARFDALGPDTTGIFEDYRGTPIPF